MDPLLIVVADPLIQVYLQLNQTRINLLAQGDAVELIEPSLMQLLDDTVGLRTLRLGAGMIGVRHHQM